MKKKKNILSKRVTIRLNEGLYEELEHKSEALGLGIADFIRILIRKFDVKLDVGKLKTIDLVGLTEAEKGKKLMKQDKLRYEEAIWDYKLKYGGDRGGIVMKWKEINKIYAKNKLREELELLGGKESLTKILQN